MRIVLLLLAIVLAVITNVVVAWGCALHSVAWALPRQPALPPDASREHLVALGWSALPTWPEPVPVIVQEFHTHGIGLKQVEYYEAAVFSRIVEPASGIAYTKGAMTMDQVGTRIRSGWPMPCLSGDRFRFSRSAGTWNMSTALATPRQFAPFKRAPERFLPLDPLVLGFIVNTITYTLVYLLLFGLLIAMRGWFRARRGRCPRCAYPVTAGSERCSECGRDRGKPVSQLP